MSDFSERLTSLREGRGWSKTYVAKLIGLKSMQTYANWEYGRTEPDFGMLSKIANAFNVSTDYLLSGKSGSGSDNNEKPMSKNQKLVAYSIDPDISDEERNDIIEMVKIAMKNRRRV